MLASISLLGCPGGGGGGGGKCPEISGRWSVGGTCTSTSCTVEQNGCSISFECDDGRSLEGTVSKSSATFSDSDVRCTGRLEGIEDDDGDGSISPTLSGSCQPTGEGDACEYDASCLSGDCTVADEDEGSDEGDSGEGGRSGQGGSSGFLGGSGGAGNGGDGPAGEGGTSGGGGVSGDGPGGTGGVGGGNVGSCGDCIDSACGSERSACDAAGECGAVLDCLLDSECSFDDSDCVQSYCEQRLSSLPPLDDEDEAAVTEIDACIAAQCASDCVSGGPVGGTGGTGGQGGFGGDSGEGGGGGGPLACDTCEWADDGVCDDGSDGGEIFCDPGTDCTDCGNAG